MKNTNLSILLIEDSIPDADILRRLLSTKSREGFCIRHAERLAQGLQYLQSEKYDLILLDLNLPDSQGIETAFIVRKSFSHVPIIILTGVDDEDMTSRALQMDIQDYLIKGEINGNLLVRSIRYAIDRKRALEELKYSEARFRAFFESAGVGAVQVDPVSRRYIQVNDRFCKITGYNMEELLSMTFQDLVHADDLESDKENFSRLIRGELTSYEVEKRYIRKDKQVVWVHVSVTMIRDALLNPIITAGVVQDITARKNAEEQIKHLADHDELTGLPNRRLFCDLMKFKVAEAKRNQTKFAILFLDLDRFKEINDTLGHDAGDEVLKTISGKLKAIIRESDIIARLGGDEFIILLSDMNHVNAISEVTRKILNSFKSSLRIANNDILATLSIGVSIYPDDGDEIDSLLRNADTAMYEAKQQGRNRHLFYNSAMNIPIADRLK